MLRFFKFFKILAVPEYLVIKVSNGGKNIPDLKKFIMSKEMLHSKFQYVIDMFDSEESVLFKKKEINEVYEIGFLHGGNREHVRRLCKDYSGKMDMKVSAKILLKIAIKLYFKDVLYLLYWFKEKMFFVRNKELKRCMSNVEVMDCEH